MSLMSLTAVALGKKIKAGEVSVTEAVQAALDAAAAKEEKVNGFVTVDGERALERAEKVQEGIRKGVYEGQYVHPGTAHYLQFQDFGKFCAHVHGGSSGKSGESRSSGDGKDEYGRVRHG